MKKLTVLLALLATTLLLSVAGPVFAGTTPLPALPPQWLIDKVINETGGPTFYPVGAPDSLYTALIPFGGALDNIENNLDNFQAVNYIATNNYLYETVVPINGSRWASLTPNMTAPGSPAAPGRIIGATYQRGRGAMVIVATFTDWSSTNPNGLRFYYDSTQYFSATLVVGTFLDPNGDRVLEPPDVGAVISDRYSCIAIGLLQVCWVPYSTDQLRDAIAVRGLLNNANSAAQSRYNLTATFGLNDAVPDMIGKNRREWCRADFGVNLLTAPMGGCQPNLAFVHATTTVVGQPIGLWVVRNWAELKAYDMAGNYWGWLPPNSYLVMDATPNRNIPGQVGVLMLVDIYGSEHFLIPSNIVQGFGQSRILNQWEAAIKDGMLRSRGF
jgi:hypothetical protein